MLRDLEIDSLHPMMMKISMIDITSKCYEFKHNRLKSLRVSQSTNTEEFSQVVRAIMKNREGQRSRGFLVGGDFRNVKKKPQNAHKITHCLSRYIQVCSRLPAVFLFF